MEAELKNQNELLETIIQNIPGSVTLRDKNGNIIFTNSITKNMVIPLDIENKATEISYEQSFTDLDGVPIQSSQVPMIRALHGESVSNYKVALKRPEGDRILDVTAVPIFQNDELAGAVAFGHDITDLVKNQREVERQKNIAEKNRLILESVIQQMPVGVILTDASGEVVKNNEAMDKIWRRGMLPTENIESHGYVAYHKDGREYQPEEWPLSRALLYGEEIIGEEMLILRGDGTKGSVNVSSAPIKDETGQIIAGVVLM
jgi:PAS domain-containing protein